MNDLAKQLPKEELFHSGHPLCPGCSGGVMTRWITKVLGQDTIATIAASCMAIATSVYPTALEIPCLYIAMAPSPAGITGVSAALRILRRKGRFPKDRKVNVIAIAGDGSAGDIGMACLSGAAERNDDGIFFCFDNEAYMNTGIQRSGCTPELSWTTSTLEGKEERKKDLPQIMAAHQIPYVATVSLGHPEDFIRKVAKARDMEPGFKYIHVYSPCPTGWRFPESKTIEVARLGVETGFWMLYEIDHGRLKLNYHPEKLRPIQDFLDAQGRFSKLTEEQVRVYQQLIDKRFLNLVHYEKCQI
jgi:pyruvate ferredoxin oxidoreductase beta subunit